MSPLLLDYNGAMSASMENRKNFAVVPAKYQDVRRLVDIEFHAFENEQVNQVLSYRDYKKPQHLERSVNIYQELLNRGNGTSQENQSEKRRSSTSSSESSLTEPGVEFRKVVDVDTGDVVSFTKYELKTYSTEELNSPADTGHEGEPLMNRDWFALNESYRREYMGVKAHCYIGMLATEPRYQHKGAGTMLLQEILAQADDAGVEVYLEGTDTAKAFYEKHGFNPLKELRFDPAVYGAKGMGTERQTVMVRGAMEADGQRRLVRPWDFVETDAETEK